jgi:hypothetical protein
MVRMAMIRKETFNGVPLLLGAEAVVTAIPSADREEKVSRTDRCFHILRLVSAVQR